MPAPLKNRTLALIGLLGMLPLALGLVRGTLTVDAAGLRAAVLLILLVLVERLVLPFKALLASADPPGRRLDDDREGHDPPAPR
jgi:hypothetical protein